MKLNTDAVFGALLPRTPLQCFEFSFPCYGAPVFSDLLCELALADQLRVRRLVDGPQGASMVIDGQRVMSRLNDYLGLAAHPEGGGNGNAR